MAGPDAAGDAGRGVTNARHDVRTLRGPDQQGAALVATLIAVIILVLAAAAGLVLFAASSPRGEEVQDARGGSPKVQCKVDAKVIEVAVEAVKAQTGAYPKTLDEIVGSVIRAAPSTARYTIALGLNASPGATKPTTPVSGPSGGPADWPEGTVLVAPGRPPVGASSYRDANAAVNPPCDDHAIR